MASKVNIIIGPALDSLQKMDSELKFDFAFIDADKTNMLEYFVEAKRLVRKGGAIVCWFSRLHFSRLKCSNSTWTTLFKMDVLRIPMILAGFPLV